MTGPSLDLDALRKKEAIYQALEWRMDRLRTAASGYEMACDIGERVSECRRHFELECSPTTILDVLSLVDDLRAENERLRAAVKLAAVDLAIVHHMFDGGPVVQGILDRLGEALAGSPAENKGNLSLVDRLVAYSDHLKSCPVAGKRPPGVCTCGYLALLDALAGSPAENKEQT